MVYPRLATISMIVALFAFPIAAFAQSGTVYVHNGPDQGETQVSTSWGDYVIYDEGGGAYWVGSQREYDRERVIGLAKQSGERLSTVNVDGADATFVPTKSFRTNIGGFAIDNIDPAVMYRIDPRNPPRPRIPADSDYVSLSWIQNPGPMPQTLLYDRGLRKAYRPYYNGSDGSQYAAEFAVPRKRTLRPMLIIFTLPGRTPGVVAIHSLTSTTYAGDLESIKQLQSEGISPERDTIQEIADLERIDPSLVHHSPPRRRSRPLPHPHVMATPHVAATPNEATLSDSAPTLRYEGTITDQSAGPGQLVITFRDNGFGKIIGGTWSASFANTSFSNSGTIDGFDQAAGIGYVFYLQSSFSNACPYHVLATIGADKIMSGKYTGVNCANGGAFSLHAVAQPSPAPQ